MVRDPPEAGALVPGRGWSMATQTHRRGDCQGTANYQQTRSSGASKRATSLQQNANTCSTCVGTNRPTNGQTITVTITFFLPSVGRTPLASLGGRAGKAEAWRAASRRLEAEFGSAYLRSIPWVRGRADRRYRREFPDVLDRWRRPEQDPCRLGEGVASLDSQGETACPKPWPQSRCTRC